MLTAVSGTSGSDVWAVGEHTLASGVFESLALHWDGTQWTHYPTPNPGGLADSFHAAVAVAASDVWALGNSASAPADPNVRTLIEHWDGTRWSRVKSPNPPGTYRDITGVAAVSAADIWAVGTYWKPDGPQVTLTLHWDGTTWTKVPSPTFGDGSFLQSVTAVSADDVWAAGGYLGKKEFPPLLLHWDGTGWTRMDGADIEGESEGLLDVDADASDDAWTVGWAYHNGGFVQHWDGTRWSLAEQSLTYLYGIDGRSPIDVVAVGATYSGGGRSTAAVLQWDGQTWALTEPIPSLTSSLRAVWSTSPDDAWSVGDYQARDGQSHYFALHYDGKKWTRISP